MAPDEKEPIRRPTVLVADDNARWRQIVVSRLSERFEVDSVEDGQAALEILRAKAIDAVVTDLDMPRMEGTDLAAALAGSPPPDAPSRRVPPIIVVTGLDSDDPRVEALRFVPHVAAVFKKPVDLDVLESAVSHAASGDVAAARKLAHLPPPDAEATPKAKAKAVAQGPSDILARTQRIPLPESELPVLDAEKIRHTLRDLGIMEEPVIHEMDYERFFAERDIEELGRGGEGAVYFLRGHVVKVAHLEAAPAALREIAHLLYLNPMRERGGVLGQRARPDWPSILWIYMLSSGSISFGMKTFDADASQEPGASLHDRLRSGPALARETSLRIIRSLAKSMVYMDSMGIIHHDLKPMNVYVPADSNQDPIIFDFGQAIWRKASWGRDWLKHKHNARYWYNGTYRYMHRERRLAHTAALALTHKGTLTDKQEAALKRYLPSAYDDVFAFARMVRDIGRSLHSGLRESDRAALRDFHLRLMGLWGEPAPKDGERPPPGLLRRITTRMFRSQGQEPAPPPSVEQRWPSMRQVTPELEKVLDKILADKRTD